MGFSDHLKYVPILREINRAVHDHEIFLSFNSDSEAGAFHEWLHQKEIWDSFKKYYEDNNAPI